MLVTPASRNSRPVWRALTTRSVEERWTWSWSGSRPMVRWTWQSMMPGRSVSPDASMRSASCGAAIAAAGPAATIRPCSSVTSTATSTASVERPSSRRAPTKTAGPIGADMSGTSGIGDGEPADVDPTEPASRPPTRSRASTLEGVSRPVGAPRHSPADDPRLPAQCFGGPYTGIRGHRGAGLREKPKSDRVTRPLGIVGNPGLRDLALVAYLADRAVRMKDELAAFREFELTSSEPTAW